MRLTRILIITVCLVFVLSLVLDLTESRRSGGGFRSSRFRSRITRSRYRSSYRSSRVSRISRIPVRHKYGAHRLGSSQLKKAAIIAGTVYGARLWMRRSSYRVRQTYPEVCYNDIYQGNVTQKYYGRFVCPGYDNPDGYRYCCGSVGSQYCCDNAFDSRSSQGSGRIAGIVIGVIIAVIVIGVVAYCCFKKRQTFEGKTLSNDAAKPLQPMGGYTATPPPPTTMTYGVQPMDTNGPPPPPYSDASYKPPMPTEDVNRGDLPYGLAPEPTPGSGYMYGQQVPANNMPYPPGEAAGYPPPSGPAPYPQGEATGYPVPPPSAPGPYPTPGGFVPPPAGNPYPQ